MTFTSTYAYLYDCVLDDQLSRTKDEICQNFDHVLPRATISSQSFTLNMTDLYEGLQPDSFRLLQLLDNIALVLSLKPYCRPIAPSHIALSYTWSPSPYQHCRSLDSDCSLTLNDDNLPVKQNLYDALKHLGKRVRTRNQSFWCDALCIDQNDMSERSDHVRHMKKIYEGAASIFAWLGVPYNERETNLAVEPIHSFTEYLHDSLHRNNDDIDIVLKSDDAPHPGFPSSPESRECRIHRMGRHCRNVQPGILASRVHLSRSNNTSPNHFLLW